MSVNMCHATRPTLDKLGQHQVKGMRHAKSGLWEMESTCVIQQKRLPQRLTPHEGQIPSCHRSGDKPLDPITLCTFPFTSRSIHLHFCLVGPISFCHWPFKSQVPQVHPGQVKERQRRPGLHAPALNSVADCATVRQKKEITTRTSSQRFAPFGICPRSRLVLTRPLTATSRTDAFPPVRGLRVAWWHFKFTTRRPH